jgi:ribosome modulation factor
MAKMNKMVTQAEWEGELAAANGRGRSTNPYPQSDIDSRNQWFGGYDRAIQRMSREERTPRLRGY